MDHNSPRNGRIAGSTGRIHGSVRGGYTRSAQQRVQRNTVNPLAQSPRNQMPRNHHRTRHRLLLPAAPRVASQNLQPLQPSIRQHPHVASQNHQFLQPTTRQHPHVAPQYLQFLQPSIGQHPQFLQPSIGQHPHVASQYPQFLQPSIGQHPQFLQPSIGQHPLHSQPQLPIPRRTPAIDGFYASCWEEICKFDPTPLSRESKRRFYLLKHAVCARDWIFLELHHLHSLYHVDFISIPLNVRILRSLPTAMRMLDEVVGFYDNSSNDELQFFTNFPFRMRSIAEKWPHGLILEWKPVISFITKSAEFGPLKVKCYARGFPPVLRELFDDVGIYSWTLQKVVFDYIVRQLLGFLPLPEYEQTIFLYQGEALNYFTLCQHVFDERIKIKPNDYDGSDRATEKDYWTRLWAHFRFHLAVPPRPSGQPINAQSDLGVIRQPQEHDTPLNRQDPAPYEPRRMSPPGGWQLPQMHKPMPWYAAIHQAHLRSPDLRAKNVEPCGYPLYQYVKGFAIAPARLPDTICPTEKWKWTFTVTPSQWQSLPKDVSAGEVSAGAPATRFLDNTTQVFRLRCIQWASDTLPNDSEWAAAETSWIPYSYFALNGTSMEKRLKSNWGRNLSINLTSLIQEGDNVLDNTILRRSGEKDYLEYLLAIEIVGTTTHAAIQEACLGQNYIPSSQRIQEIKQNLAPSDDGDVVVVGGVCSIDLYDPISGFKVCDIPVRGPACTHYECFDLETFLKTRPREGDAVKPDCWECPVCKRDARPHLLMVDGFLKSVRDDLARRGLLNKTRFITVASDGTWEAKAEDRIQDRNDADIEVIDLTD